MPPAQETVLCLYAGFRAGCNRLSPVASLDARWRRKQVLQLIIIVLSV